MSAPVQACEKCLCPGDAKVGTPAGKITEYAGVEAYVTGSSKDAAIVYSTDIWGHEFLKNQLLADQFAAAGFTVVVPKTLNDAVKPEKPLDMAGFPVWLGRNPTAHAAEVATKVAEALAKEFPSVQGIGFCYGARPILDIIAQRPELLKAAVLNHPTFAAKEDAATIKIPVLFNLAERDNLFSNELKDVFVSTLKDLPGNQFITYPDTDHGFSARPHGEAAEKAAAVAAVNTIAFFNKNK